VNKSGEDSQLKGWLNADALNKGNRRCCQLNKGLVLKHNEMIPVGKVKVNK